MEYWKIHTRSLGVDINRIWWAIPVDLERDVLTIHVPEKDLQFLIEKEGNVSIIDVPENHVLVIVSSGE